MEEASRAAQVALWEWDLRTGERNWTDVVDSLLGYEPGAVPRTNRAWEAVVHPEDLPRVTGLLERHIEQDEPYDIEYRVKKRDKTYVWCRDRGVCLRDEKGKAYRMAGACLDVTEQKRAEQARQRSEERFRFVADNAGELIWEVDRTGLYRYCSSAAEKILGYSAGELVGRKYFYDLFPPEARDELKDAALKAFERKQPFRGFVNPNVRKDGEIVILETTGAPILDENGEPPWIQRRGYGRHRAQPGRECVAAPELARIDSWAKDISPSSELRKWYGHDPAKWAECNARYFAELDRAAEGVERLRKELAGGPATFVYGSKETVINNAEALKLYLENRPKKRDRA